MPDSIPSPGRRPAHMTAASFALRHEQIKQIRLLAGEMHISQSELMRRAIDLLTRETVREALEELQRVRGSNQPLTDIRPAPHLPGGDT